MDRELEELARLSLLEERLSVLRHDLANRLNSIRNGAFYLKRKSERTNLWVEDPRFPLFFDLIEKEIVSGTKLLDQASAADLMLRRFEPQMLEVGVKRGLEQVRIPATVALETDFGQCVPKPLWDVEVALLTRCLVENAVEAVEGAHGARIRLRTRSEGEGAWLTVEDSGPGIPAEAMASAMQPFRSEKPGHRGIGLNIARRIVRRYEGNLELHESEGGGLAVEAHFP